MLTDAFTYPIRSGGWIVLLVGAIFSIIVDFLAAVPLLGLPFAIFGAGYFGAFYLEIVGTTMIGRDDIPEWPGISDMWNDILLPFFQIAFLLVLSFGPAAVVFILTGEEASWFTGAGLVALLFGCVYFPMAVLATQAFGGVRGAMPDFVFPAILKVMPGYLLPLGVLILVFAVCSLAREFLSNVPLIGWAIAAAIALYGLMFQGRLIGLIYRHKKDRFDWD